MKISKLLVCNLSITEDQYSFGGSFSLSDGSKTLDLDISDIESPSELENIKAFFELEEETKDIRSYLMSEIVDKSSISSRIKEGESSPEGFKPGIAGELDMS